MALNQNYNGEDGITVVSGQAFLLLTLILVHFPLLLVIFNCPKCYVFLIFLSIFYLSISAAKITMLSLFFMMITSIISTRSLSMCSTRARAVRDYILSVHLSKVSVPVSPLLFLRVLLLVLIFLLSLILMFLASQLLI